MLTILSFIGGFSLLFILYLYRILPFISWMVELDIVLIHIILMLIIVSVGGVLLVVAFSKKKSKTHALWILSTIPFFIVGVSILDNQYGNAEFRGDYIRFNRSGCGYGLKNKFGKIFIEPNYNAIMKVYDKESSKVYYVGCDGKDINLEDDNNAQRAYDFYLFNEDGELEEVRSSKHHANNLTEYIERYIGPIMTYYGGDISIHKYEVVKSKTATSSNRKSKSSSDLIESSSSSSNSSTHTPQRHEQTIPVQVWKNCVSCMGTGQCSYCYGQGYITDMYGTHDCPVCTDGRCSMCAGRGGQYEVQYQTRVDYY